MDFLLAVSAGGSILLFLLTKTHHGNFLRRERYASAILVLKIAACTLILYGHFLSRLAFLARKSDHPARVDPLADTLAYSVESLVDAARGLKLARAGQSSLRERFKR
ncbi:MAG: hypothetical protein U0V48_05505 [Anaerolineales bacterium]